MVNASSKKRLTSVNICDFQPTDSPTHSAPRPCIEAALWSMDADDGTLGEFVEVVGVVSVLDEVRRWWTLGPPCSGCAAFLRPRLHAVLRDVLCGGGCTVFCAPPSTACCGTCSMPCCGGGCVAFVASVHGVFLVGVHAALRRRVRAVLRRL